MADTTNTTGTGEITGASENVAEDAVLAGAEGRDVLVGQAGQGETVQVTDESQEISVDPGDNFVLPDGIALGDIDFQQAEGSLVIVLPRGSEITFTDFFIIAGEEEDGGLPPVLTLSDGTVMESPLARVSQTHLGGVSSGADEPGCGSICVALRQSGPGLIV